MASELRVNTLKDAAGNNSIATSFVAGGSAKVWVNFSMAGTTARDSLNLSSLTDTTTGKFNVAMSSAFTNADYTPVGYTNGYSSAGFNPPVSLGLAVENRISRTSTTYGFDSYGASGYVDAIDNRALVVGDLA
jgi:glycerol uptake facilitator-like aquaporin